MCEPEVQIGNSGLFTPTIMQAGAAPQEDRQQDEHTEAKKNKKRLEKERKVYDRQHNDYHNWDTNEDRAYRNYLNEQHKSYRDFSRLKRQDQDKYWQWRHENQDADNPGRDDRARDERDVKSELDVAPQKR